jgi:alpha-L-fucosidase
MNETQTEDLESRIAWLREARLGMFCHWGLYSLLGRGEWVMNREQIPPAEYEKLAERFTAEKFDAGKLADLALLLGAKYMVFTTKHHEGFCHWDSKLTDYTAAQRGPKRDLLREVVEACRERGLRVGLYFSLNDWHHQPDAVAALEDEQAHEEFLAYVHGQIRELLTNYGHIDVMWYDGWWPFDAVGWRAEKMNAMVRELQPHILINNRNALPGDFGTPEQHMTPTPGRLWEACLTTNDSWGYSPTDRNWKRPEQLIQNLLLTARRQGNLLLNVGPRGDGSIPEEYYEIFGRLGDWVRSNGEAFFNTDPEQMDWIGQGTWTVRGKTAYLHVLRWPGEELVVTGLQCQAQSARLLVSGEPVRFEQNEGKLRLSGLPAEAPDPLNTVIAIEMDRPPRQYCTGGMRVPKVPHCQYDPVDPDLLAPPGG